MSSESGEDWQSNKKSIQERNAHMFNNFDMSDIQLACGDTNAVVFYAHKYVLATSSPVFHKMFYGSLPESGPVIHLPDTDKESLEAFLRYLYTDETPSTPELALKVMYLAHKYMITALVNECINIVKVSPEKAFFAIRYAMLVQEESLIQTAWQVVDSRTREVVKSEHFCDIDASLLSEFLKRDSLRITEIELFRAVLKWTESQCEKRDLEVTEENRKTVLGDAIYHLRFLAMSQEEFLKGVVPTRLINSEDTLSILQKFLGENPESLKWTVTKKRCDYLRLARFDAENVRAPSIIWSYLFPLAWYHFAATSLNYFRIESTQEDYGHEDVMFWGVRVFGDACGSTYHVTMTIQDESNCHLRSDVSGSYTSESLTGSTCGFDVVLQKPFKIKVNKRTRQTKRGLVYDQYSSSLSYPNSPYILESNWHTVKLTVKGPSSYYGVGGKNTVKTCEHVKVDMQCYARDRGGQIWQLLLTPCQPCKSCQLQQVILCDSKSRKTNTSRQLQKQ